MAEVTGYWVFNCNPRTWHRPEDYFAGRKLIYDLKIRPSDRGNFRVGDLGVIRVGHDPRKVLRRGVYAVVEVTGEVQDRSSNTENSPCVPVRIISVPRKPLLLDELRRAGIENQRIIKGVQGASLPLDVATYNQIVKMVAGR